MKENEADRSGERRSDRSRAKILVQREKIRPRSVKQKSGVDQSEQYRKIRLKRSE